ncbi:MAG: ATP-binding cassette domain-containing protein [Bacteroidota bacterium]
MKLSGGQKQLVSLARALYSKPDFLLLDEFTSSMDRNTKSLALEILNSLRIEMGVIIITHDEEILNLATSRIDLNQLNSST